MTLFNLNRTKRRRRRPASFCFFQYLAKKGRTTPNNARLPPLPPRPPHGARLLLRSVSIFGEFFQRHEQRNDARHARRAQHERPVEFRHADGCRSDACQRRLCHGFYCAQKRCFDPFDYFRSVHHTTLYENRTKGVTDTYNIQRLNPLFLFYRSILELGYY